MLTIQAFFSRSIGSQTSRCIFKSYRHSSSLVDQMKSSWDGTELGPRLPQMPSLLKLLVGRTLLDSTELIIQFHAVGYTNILSYHHTAGFSFKSERGKNVRVKTLPLELT